MNFKNKNNTNIVLCIGYEGTYFYGFQRQVQERSVQGVLESHLSEMFRQEIAIQSAGRTDSGVHAEHHFLNFHVENPHIPSEKISQAINTTLPSDLRAFWSKEVTEDFHARYSALSRTYYYQIYEGNISHPIYRNYTLTVPKGLDWSLIQKDCNEFLGTHDFSAFSTYNTDITNHVRTILSIEIQSLAHVKRIYIEANAFLWKMVRIIVGTIIERAIHRQRNKALAMSISDIVKTKDRNFAGKTAPPQGLFLYNVKYKEKYGISI